jgi:hypothetical protein
MWRRVDIVWTNVSEERIAAIFKVEKSARKEPAGAGGCRLLLARGFFYSEDGCDTFLRNVGSHKIYTPPHPRRPNSSFSIYFILIETHLKCKVTVRALQFHLCLSINCKDSYRHGNRRQNLFRSFVKMKGIRCRVWKLFLLPTKPSRGTLQYHKQGRIERVFVLYPLSAACVVKMSSILT